MKPISCNLCGSTDSTLLYRLKDRMIRVESKDEFNLYLCKRCGLAYLNPQPEWEELEYFYGGNYYTNVSHSERKSSLGEALYQLLRKLKRAIIGPPHPKFWHFGKETGRFLDVGCGNGAYDAYVIKDYPRWEFYGVEPSALSASLAKKITHFNVFNGFLENAHYESDFFDVILMSHSLEHTFDPKKTIEEAFRILKKGGRLIIKVPNFACPSRRFFGTYWYHLDAPRHLFHFAPEVVAVILKNAGFTIESVRFEALSGSVLRSIAYYVNRKQFFFEKQLILMCIHYVLVPIKKVVEWFKVGSGQEVIAIKK